MDSEGQLCFKRGSDGVVVVLGSASHDVAWEDITGTPTTLAGYGITDAGAKLVDVVDRAARLALTSSQVNVGDIVREVGEVVENSITVTGAGDPDADGVYIPEGTENGRTKWRNQTNTQVKLVWAGSNYWLFYNDDTASAMYSDSDELDVSSPLDVVNWGALDSGSPVPVLSETGTPPGGTYSVTDVANLASELGYVNLTSEILCLVYLSEGPELALASHTFLPFDTPIVNYGDCFNIVESEFTAPANGTYGIETKLAIAGDAVSPFNLDPVIALNGATPDVNSRWLPTLPVSAMMYPAATHGQGVTMGPAAAVAIPMKAGDTLKVYAWFTGPTLEINTSFTYLKIIRL